MGRGEWGVARSSRGAVADETTKGRSCATHRDLQCLELASIEIAEAIRDVQAAANICERRAGGVQKLQHFLPMFPSTSFNNIRCDRERSPPHLRP